MLVNASCVDVSSYCLSLCYLPVPKTTPRLIDPTSDTSVAVVSKYRSNSMLYTPIDCVVPNVKNCRKM